MPLMPKRTKYRKSGENNQKKYSACNFGEII